MLQVAEYENFVRKRITQLRHRLHVSEHKMSLDLGKSGSYMRSISIGKAMPSMHEFLRICEYLGVTRRNSLPVPGMKPTVSTFLTDCKTSMTVTYRSCRHSLVGWKKSKSTFCPTSFCLPGFCFCRAYLVERRIAWQMCLTLR